MKYTRYNYKPPKKNNNIVIVFTLILIAAIVLGTVFSKLLPNNASATSAQDKTTKISLPKDSKTNKDSVDVSKVITQNDIKDYVALQCGVFSTKESALLLKNSLTKFGIPFIIEEGKLNKVFLGVYPKDGVDSIVKQLTASKIIYVKVNLQLTGKDLTSAQTNEIISADIKILNKLSENDIKAIQTVELKQWMGALKGEDKESKSYSAIIEIKSYINALPKELKKDKTEEGYIYIYKFINKLSKV